MKIVAILRVIIIVVLRNLLILLSCLHLASIALLPKREVEVVAAEAHPISLPRLRGGLTLVLAGLVAFFEWGKVLIHGKFLLRMDFKL